MQGAAPGHAADAPSTQAQLAALEAALDAVDDDAEAPAPSDTGGHGDAMQGAAPSQTADAPSTQAQLAAFQAALDGMDDDAEASAAPDAGGRGDATQGAVSSQAADAPRPLVQFAVHQAAVHAADDDADAPGSGAGGICQGGGARREAMGGMVSSQAIDAPSTEAQMDALQAALDAMDDGAGEPGGDSPGGGNGGGGEQGDGMRSMTSGHAPDAPCPGA